MRGDDAGAKGRCDERRIRIVYLIWNLKPAGAERQLLELIRRLDVTRFEPHLVLFRHGPMDVECACPVTYVSTSAGWTGNRVLAGALTFFRLLRVLRGLNPDLLHSFLPELLQVFGAVAAKLLRIPVFVCSRRASAGLYRRGWLRRIAESIAMKMTDAMVVNAGCLREELVRVDGYPRERIALVRNGVDAERFRPGLAVRVNEFGWTEDCVVAGMVANFRACKRHEDFLRAAAFVRKTHAKARFLLVGNDAGSLQAVRRLIGELQLEDVVRIATGCSRPEELFGSMHLVICTSETEGLSNALLEAMACGLPVVATRVGGNPEIVRDGCEGILVPAGEPEAVANAMGTLMDDAGLRQRMGAAGRRRALGEFSMDGMVAGYEELYGNLLVGIRRSEVEVYGTGTEI